MEKFSTTKGPVREFDDLVDSFSSSSSSTSGILSGSSISLESDSFEEVTSHASSSSSSSSPHDDDHQLVVLADPLSDMSSLVQQLPIKRGLSRFYQGKSQSFTSLTNVRSLEDLAKAENPYNKRLKSCKSYAGVCNIPNTMSPSSRGVSKAGTTSRGSCSSLNARRGTTATNFRPPIPAQRSTSTNTIPNQPFLLA
ncbi:hypothetical protein Fmac_014385 [Flemingia macrophylla]|uniref:Oxidative stress 3 n=1 Tax=Flemingia macrophylla TaxID=520843 RepID=A0ABD1MBP1_9FABA